MKGTVNAFLEIVGGNDNDGEGDQADQGQLPVRPKHDTQHAQNGKQVGYDRDKTIGKNIIDTLNIIDGACGKGANGRTVKLPKIQVEYFIEDFYPDVFNYGLTDPGSDIRKVESQSRFH
jgi:hypothetical protein